MADQHKNFAYSTVATAPSPATSGTSLIVASGDGNKFPTPPFNATIWPTATQPTLTGDTATTAEIVRVTGISTDTLTIERADAATTGEPNNTATNRTIVTGDQIAASVTAKTLTDIENNYVNSWTPFMLQTGSGLQTLAANGTNNAGTGSMLLFPVTLQAPVKFNQILVGNSLSLSTSARTESIANSYYSYFGIYSMQSSTLFSLISSNSFSIGLTLSQNGATNASLTANYPTTTHTSGYGYGNFPAGNLTGTAQISSYVSGSRIVGLQFGGEMSLSGGIYWIGLLSVRSTSVQSTYGFSNAGIMGQVINPINQIGTGVELLPLGMPGANWANLVTSNTAWFGRHIIAHLTATSILNYAGTRVPDNVTISQLGATVTNSYTVLPSVTFVST